jgi:hypothetical protein
MRIGKRKAGIGPKCRFSQQEILLHNVSKEEDDDKGHDDSWHIDVRDRKRQRATASPCEKFAEDLYVHWVLRTLDFVSVFKLR